MVLEKIIPEAWLERKPFYGLLLGIGYSIVGIILGSLIFKKDPAIPAVAFTSLFLIPIVRKLFFIEEEEKKQNKKFGWLILYRQNKDIFWTYFFLFFGIFLVFSMAAAVLPSFQVNKLFREQLGLRVGAAAGFAGSAGDSGSLGIAGMAGSQGTGNSGVSVSNQDFILNPETTALDTYNQSASKVFYANLFWSILKNNWWVFIATLVIAVLAGEGGVFFIAWNASVWGTIFGTTARNAAIFSHANAIFYLFIILLIVFPHMFLEIGSYLLAGISGGIFSTSVGKEKLFSKDMKIVALYVGGMLVLGIVFLILGALVETFVLGNNITYQTIISNSYFGK